MVELITYAFSFPRTSETDLGSDVVSTVRIFSGSDPSRAAQPAHRRVETRPPRLPRSARSP